VALHLQASELSDEYLHAIADNCVHLEELLLCDTRGYTADGVSRLVGACPNIRHVSVWETEPTPFNKAVRGMWQRNRPTLRFTNACAPLKFRSTTSTAECGEVSLPHRAHVSSRWVVQPGRGRYQDPRATQS
jgi:hypothetical protein